MDIGRPQRIIEVYPTLLPVPGPLEPLPPPSDPEPALEPLAPGEPADPADPMERADTDGGRGR